jgi:hypothetical protein
MKERDVKLFYWGSETDELSGGALDQNDALVIRSEFLLGPAVVCGFVEKVSIWWMIRIKRPATTMTKSLDDEMYAVVAVVFVVVVDQ